LPLAAGSVLVPKQAPHPAQFFTASPKTSTPMTYRVTFTDKEVVSIQPTDAGAADPTTDTILEEQTGQTLYATIEAADETEAREKAGRLQTELRTRRTKRDLEGSSTDDDDAR